MSDHAAILAALDGLERIRNRLTALPRDNVEGWKQQYVAIRRELQAEFAAFNKAAEPLLAGGIDGIDGYRLRGLVNAFRSRLAEHQARFPVVTIDPIDADYWTSMKAVDAARQEVVAYLTR